MSTAIQENFLLFIKITSNNFLNLNFRPLFSYLAQYFIRPDSFCWLSLVLELKFKNFVDCEEYTSWPV
jgi:hypothetical protein